MAERFCLRCGRGFAAAAAEPLCGDCSGGRPGPAGADRSDGQAIHCVACGREFRPAHPDATLCPECAQPASVRAPGEAPTVARPVGAPWQVGDVVAGLYEVRRVFTSGGMGLVYQVWHRGWNRELAVKSPRPEALAQAGGAEKFVLEAETWMDLGLHPQIVTCHYVRTIDDVPRVFAEYVGGGSLKDWITDGRLYAGAPGELSARLLDVAIQFAWGLAYAHDRGLVHRDVKPANVLLTVGGLAKVTDFGLARSRVDRPVVIPDAQGRDRQLSTAWMTPAYCSPEQAEVAARAAAGLPLEAGAELTQRTDIYSWAVSMLEVFLRERVSGYGQTAPDELEQYLAGDPPEGLPAMPPELADLLRECLRADPERRPRDFHLVAERLSEIYRVTTGSPYPRRVTGALDLLAPTLNNRAVSQLELGKPEAARRTMLAAQEADPDLPELVYNKAVVDWRDGRITDLEAVARAEACASGRPGEWRPVELLATLHMERCDRDAALAALAHHDGPAPQEELARLRQEIDSGSGSWARQLVQAEDKAEPLTGVAISPDGRTVWAAGAEYRSITVDSAGAGGILREIDAATGRVRSSCVVPGSQLTSIVRAGDHTVLAGSLDGVLHAFAAGTLADRRIAQHQGRIFDDLVVGGDGRHLFATDNPRLSMGGGQVTCWDLGTGQAVRELSMKGCLLHSLAVDEDGGVLAGGSAWSGSGEFLVFGWDRDGVLTSRLGAGLALGGEAVALAVLPGTRLLVSGHADGSLRFWDLRSGELLRSVSGHTDSVQSVVALPRDGLVLTASDDRSIRVWDSSSGVCLRSLEGHQDGLRGLGLSADGNRLVSGSRDGDVRVWDLTELPGPPRRWAICSVSSAQQAADTHSRFLAEVDETRQALGRGDWARAASAAADARRLPGMERHPEALALWAEVTRHGRPGKLTAAWTALDLPGHTAPVRSVLVDPAGRLAVSGAGDGRISVWDLRLGELRNTLTGHEGAVRALALLPDGERFVSGGADGTVRLWRLDGAGGGEVLRHGKELVGVVAVTPDGRYVVAGVDGGLLHKASVAVHDLTTGHSFTVGSHKRMGSINCVAPTPDGRHVLVGEVNLTNAGAGFDLHGVLNVFDLDRRKSVALLEAEDYPPVAGAVALDGRRAVTTCWNRDLVVWDLVGERVESVVEGERGGMPDMQSRALVLRGDGRVAVNAGDDGKLRVWDLEERRLVRELEAHAGDASALAMGPDARTLVSGGEDGKVRVWGLDWDYAFPPAAEFDAAAVPYLEALLTLRTRLGLTDEPEPVAGWLQDRLADCGLGWIRVSGIRSWLTTHQGGRP